MANKMQIETKFDIWQKVWFAVNHCVVGSVVDGINIDVWGVGKDRHSIEYIVTWSNLTPWFKIQEHHLFASKEKLINSLLEK